MRALVISLVLIVYTTISHAWVRPAPGRWDLSGEYLYLLPMISESYYAQDLSSGFFPTGQRHNHNLAFKSAFRVAAMYECNCWTNFQLVWTSMPQFSHNASLTQSLLQTQGLPNFGSSFNYSHANSRISFSFDAVEALFGFWRHPYNGLDFVFRTGLHYANFNFHENITVVLNDDFPINVHNRSDTWGIGPEISFAMQYTPSFCGNFFCERGALSLCASVKGALLAGNYEPFFVQSDFFSNSRSHNGERWDLIPFWDIRLGMNYSMLVRSITASLEVGYEMISYHNVIDRIVFNRRIAPGYSFDLYSDVNFQGPYVALRASF